MEESTNIDAYLEERKKDTKPAPVEVEAGQTERPFLRPKHPLDPLSPDEIRRAVAYAKQTRPKAKFVTVTLLEPNKDELEKWKPGDPLDRKVFIVLHSPSKEKTYEMIISLFVDEVTSLKHLPGVQPRLMPHEYILMEQLVRRHPDVIEALKKRGITDLEKVKADLWGCGWFTDDDDPKRRLGFPLLYYKRDDDAEEYNTPIEGIVPLVDLNKMEVLKVDDLRVLPLPPATSNYRTKYKESKLPQPKPLIVSQPEGVSFSLDGWHLTWQNWDMRIGFNPREGVVLQQVGILDPDTLQRRSILHRASLAEMIVPYSHPQAPHYRKNAFDVGEDGMGVNLNSLRGGCDCIGEPRFLDVHLTDGDGNLYTIPDAICVHEEDAGILFKHTDYRTGQAYMRRGRRLVVSCFATIANYDYGLSWLFYLDGTIQYEATLTGILSTKVVGGGESRFGPTVGPYVAATNHQHFFCMKLDMAVDGPKNSVSEINTETSPPSDLNVHKNAFITTKTQFKTELEAARVCNQLNGRYWMIYNPAKHNKWGTNVAYKLVPETNVLPLVSPDATIVKRAPFLQKHFWVTRSDPSLKYPAGDYPNQAKHEGNGLTNWVNGDRSIDNTDIVVWYNFGVHHIPTPEEWPIMSGVRHGFFLKPCGFFNENPAMYIAPQPCTTKGSAPLIPSKQPPNVETIKPTKPPVHHARL